MNPALQRLMEQAERSRAPEADLLAEVRALRAQVQRLVQAQAASQSDAVSISIAAAMIGCGRTKAFELLSAGELKPAGKLGRERMVTRASVEALVRGDVADPEPKRRAPRPPAVAGGAGWGDAIRQMPLPARKAKGRPGEPGEAAT